MSELVEQKNELVEQKNELVEPKNELVEQKNEPQFDSELIQEIVDKVNKKLEKKLYYGRKQEKLNEKQDKKIKNQLVESQKDTLGFYIISGFLLIVSFIMCFFGIKHLREQQKK